MCGILGIRCKDTEIGGVIFEQLLRQSQIRGKHATGISYYENDKIETETRPIPANSFADLVEMPESTYILGHTRYSTSNLMYNQPISNNKLSIAHNGVITQEAPEKWEKHFGYDNLKTTNDSELVLKCLSHDNVFNRKLLFTKFPTASIACGVLKNKKMSCFRNNTRPLWIFESVICFGDEPAFTGFASTKDIIERTFKEFDSYFEVIIKEAKPFVEYVFEEDGTIKELKMTKPSIMTPDQQKSTKIESKYV